MDSKISKTVSFKSNQLKARVLSVVLLVICLIAMTGCTVQSAGAADATANGDSQAVAMTTICKGVVIDSTSSTGSQFSEIVRNCLVDELGSWEGKQDDDLTDGADAILGLELWIMIVGDNPTASGSSQHLHLSLPEVKALPARPSLEDDEALDEIHSWNKLKNIYDEEYEAFCLARDEATASLQAFDLSTDQWSGVFSTVGALSGVVDPGADILLASDNENNQDPQVAGSLEGSKIYILQPTPSGDMAYADELFNSAVDFLLTMGVCEEDITRYRDELAKEAVHAFMLGN